MQELEREVLTFLQERDWDTLRPSDLAKSISIEAAELLEVFQWGSVDLEEARGNEKLKTKVREELADVLIYALEMAALLKLDSRQIVLDKLEHNRKKYPADIVKHIDRGDGEPGGDATYLALKKAYRQKAS